MQQRSEGDAKEIIHALQCDSLWRRTYCMLVDEARKNLKHQRDWCVKHVFGQANDTAHKLAKLAISIREEILWNRDYPSCIHVNVLADQVSH
jgi:hypothetical protein